MVPTVPMPVVVPAMMPMMVPVVMPVPTHLSCRQLRILSHRYRGARIDQRHRLRAADRRRHDEKRADSRQAQNFRSVHSSSPSPQGIFTSALLQPPLLQLLRRDADENLESVT